MGRGGARRRWSRPPSGCASPCSCGWVVGPGGLSGGRVGAWPARGLAPARARCRRSLGLALGLALAQWQLTRDRDPLARAARAPGRRRPPSASPAISTPPPPGRAAGAGRRARRPPTTAPPRFEALEPAGARAGPRDERRGPRRGGRPWAWAGRHRLPPRARGRLDRLAGDWILRRARGPAPLARRPGRGRRRADLGAPGRARPGPEPGRAVPGAHRGRAHGVSRRAPRRTAPTSSTTRSRPRPGRRLLFSVQPVPPEQGTAKELAFERGSRWRHLARAARLELALGLASRRRLERFRCFSALVWLAVRAPSGRRSASSRSSRPPPSSGRCSARSPAPPACSRSRGTLLTIGGVWLWRRRLPRRWYGVALGVALLLASPYLISSLGRGHHAAGRRRLGRALAELAARPPGVRLGAHRPDRRAVPRRRAGEPHPAWRIGRGRGDRASRPRSSACWSGARGAAGPTGTRSSGRRRCCWSRCPRPRWAAISGIALVAGSSAALVTWGAELSGRIQVAQRDVARLGDEPDPLAVPLLERFGEQVRRRRGARRPPRRCTRSGTAPRWATRAIRRTWRSGRRRARCVDELALDSLDLPPSLLSTMVRGPAAERQRCGSRRSRGSRACTTCSWSASAPDEVMTAAVGPALASWSCPGGWAACSTRRASSRRSIGSRSAPPPDPSARHARARAGGARAGPCGTSIPLDAARRHAGWCTRPIDLRGPVPLFVRGVLVVLLDAAVLARALVPGGAGIAARRLPRAALAEPRPLVPDPARRHAGRVLPPARGRVRGLELRPPGRGGRAEPRPADHPDAAGRGAHRAAASLRGGGADRRGSAPRAEPADRRRSRALSRRPARRHQHAGARGSRRAAPADGSRRPSRRWRSSGELEVTRDGSHSRAGRAGRLPGGPAGEPGRHRRAGHAAAGRRLARWPCGSSTWRWCCCWPRWRASPRRWSGRRSRLAHALPAGGRAAPLGAGAGQRPADAGALRASAARVRAGVRRLRADGRRHPLEPERAGGGPPAHGGRARAPSPPASSASTPRAGCSSPTARRWICSATELDEGDAVPRPARRRTGRRWPRAVAALPASDPAADATGGARGRRAAGSPSSSPRSGPTCAAW